MKNLLVKALSVQLGHGHGVSLLCLDPVSYTHLFAAVSQGQFHPQATLAGRIGARNHNQLWQHPDELPITQGVSFLVPDDVFT